MQKNAGSGPAHDEGAAASRCGMPPMWRRLEGTLVYDSREQRPTGGVRSSRAGAPRLMYRASGFEIDLQIRPGSTADRLRVVGQVLDAEFEPCPGWVVLEAAHGFVKTGLDDCGHFSIDGLVAGWHRFEVSLLDATIEIPSLYL